MTSGKITKVAKVNGTWLIWFNGEEAYCCTHGANGQPAGCPSYTYVNTSTVSADQCVPGDHYGNQIRIWGGLNQLSLGDADDLPAVFSADEGEEISLLDFCASIYDDVQMYIIENFPESTAAEIYLASADELANGVETYASARGYYTYIYNPGRAGWQTVALIGPEIGEEEPEPEPVVQEYYASWEAPAQTASGSFDFSYGIRTDKIQLKTQEKVDGATIEIEPIAKSGSIDGGSWSVSPASKQTVTTSGHTADDNYQKNGGDAAASWSLQVNSGQNDQAVHTTYSIINARQVNRLSRHLKKIFVLGGVPFIKAGGRDHAALEGNTAAKHRLFRHRFGAGIDDLLPAAKTGQPPLLEFAYDLLPA